VMFGGEGSEEEGGKGGGGDVPGGEAEDILDFFARIELGVLSNLKRCEVSQLGMGSLKGKWVPMDHSKSKKHEGLAVFLAVSSNISKKLRIVVLLYLSTSRTNSSSCSSMNL